MTAQKSISKDKTVIYSDVCQKFVNEESKGKCNALGMHISGSLVMLSFHVQVITLKLFIMVELTTTKTSATQAG